VFRLEKDPAVFLVILYYWVMDSCQGIHSVTARRTDGGQAPASL
jgi:hypothetical protein